MDPLFEKILAGLAQLTDREQFEACACDLLRKHYPRLVPVPGGSDAGFDGAAIQETGESIQLVCTTGDDVIGNLTGSLEEAQKKERKSNAVLVATSQQLSPAQKQNLTERAAQFRKTLYPVYDQQAIANLLYHDSRWRKALLNLPGNPPALSQLPANHRPTFELPPLGRDSESNAISSETGDLVVVGQPGSGKTHLLAHLAKKTNGLFVVTDELTAIADGLRDQQPQWVIVDDAFTRLDDLISLRQLRADVGADFRIVATCWPGQHDDVAAKLGLTGKKPVELQLLPVAIIKRIISAMQIGGPDELIHELLHQSAGKPGLAVTLCQLCWQHGTRELFTGEALARDVRLSLTALAGEDSVRLLAHFALAGNSGLTIEAAARITGLVAMVVARLAEKMGAAGVLEERQDRRLSVEPARLRQGLVRDVFCSPHASIDWRPMLAEMPDRSETTATLIAAALLGGEVDEAALRQEIAALREAMRCGELCDQYARLGPTQSRWVLDEFPEYVVKASEPLLTHVPREAIPVLLKIGLSQKGIFPGNREELKELRKWIDERANTLDSIPRRVELLSALEKMHDQLRDTSTLLVGVRHTLSNEFEWMNQPPGAIAEFRIQHGFVPPAALEEIAALWPRAFRLLTGLSTSNALKLPALIAEWANPRQWGSGEINPDFAAVCENHARTMLADLAREYATNWVVMRHFLWTADRIGYALPKPTGLPAMIFPPRVLGREDEAHEQQQAAVDQLAGEWTARGPDAVMLEEWIRVHREADEANATYPNLSRELAHLLAQRATRPNDWLSALLLQDAPAQLVEPFIERSYGGTGVQMDEFVNRFLEHPLYGALAINCLLRFVSPKSDVWRKATPLVSNQASTAGHLVLLNAVPDPTILSLLTDFGRDVAAEVAAEMWTAKPKGEIPAELFSAWRGAVVRAVESGYQLEEVARQFPDLAFDWVKHRLNRTWEEKHDLLGRDLDRSFSIVVANLSIDQRRILLDNFSEKSSQTDAVAQLVGTDLDLFRHALARTETSNRVVRCLGTPGDPINYWVDRAIILLDAGIEEEEVLYASGVVGGSWTGPTSRYYEEKRLRFLPLLNHSDVRIRRIGQTAEQYLSKERDDWRNKEHRAAVRGEFI